MKADPDEDDTFLFVKSEFSVTYQAVEGKKFFVNSFTVKSFHAMIIFMNIQIFGTKKCSDTRKAERFFKERGIKYQFVDMKEKGMSKGEVTSVAQANGGLENMINWEGKDKDTLALIKYIADEDKLAKILENPQVIKTPVVRNGKQSTLGYQPDVWKGWK